MIRLALPKGRNLAAALAALRAAGCSLNGLAADGRQLRVAFPADGFEVLLLKDWDLPRYVEHGVADLGIVGSDVLAEVDGDLLTPARLVAGRCRLALIGRPGALPAPGSQVRLATKYPQIARRWVAGQAWSAEVLELSGSVELAPLVDLADLIVDLVQSGQTLRDNGLAELRVILHSQAVLVANRAAWRLKAQAIGAFVAALRRALEE